MGNANKDHKKGTNRIRLLLVDDEEGYVNVLANRLGKRNVDVTKAFSGSEAIKAVRNQDFDVAILDLKMEDMNGIEVLKIFNQMGLKMEVIMLTGHGSQEAAEEGLSIGAFDYLTKPYSKKDIQQLIRRVLKHRNITQKSNQIDTADRLEIGSLIIERLLVET